MFKLLLRAVLNLPLLVLLIGLAFFDLGSWEYFDFGIVTAITLESLMLTSDRKIDSYISIGSSVVITILASIYRGEYIPPSHSADLLYFTIYCECAISVMVGLNVARRDISVDR